jgi:hypothetical protein
MMLKCNPRQLHNHMIESFENAIGKGNTVIVSESKLKDILRTSCSHVKKMTAREKLMCGCKTCIIFDDMHQCLNLFRKKYVTNKQREILAMRDGRSKLMANNAKLDDNINQVCSDPIGKKPKYCMGWDAASLLGYPTVTIDGRNYSPFSCVLRDCAVCQDKWKNMIPTRERTCTDMISYVLFGSHSKCSYHGDNYMRLEGKEYHCTICDIVCN